MLKEVETKEALGLLVLFFIVGDISIEKAVHKSFVVGNSIRLLLANFYWIYGKGHRLLKLFSLRYFFADFSNKNFQLSIFEKCL